ncbi:hypothetical protein DYY66_1294 [Candidatus Nitrosotalea sp. FS]|uniref:hypothetical protein n=1 Tax=Candidatus Nitrosotalea sp. FS TaxID=2341021 RepID=UPI0014091FC6|nr:hypothetical protein [Candidatus Nitrosotalea sp. FS]NHH97533.1 hypothetical protein [Candidatus Nitrosotalea sp. FS]
MNKIQRYLVAVLASICVVGAFGIPLGDPKFLIPAIILESSFIALVIVSLKNFRYAYIPNFIIAGIVIAGNTISPKHLEIMSTFHPFYNAIVLIIGGYVLQALLLITNGMSLREYRSTKIEKSG